VTSSDGVAVIGRPAYTLAGLTAAADATRRAISDRAPVVYQAAMFDGRFVGFADFLVLDGERYRITDTKLARSAKVTALLQLAACADALADSGVPVAPEAELELGDDTVVRYRVGDLIPVYRSQRALLQRLLDEHYAAGAPVRWEDEAMVACFRCPLCAEQLRATDDLLLVAGMRVTQRDKLIDAGITTVTELGGHTGPVPEPPRLTLDGRHLACVPREGIPARAGRAVPPRPSKLRQPLTTSGSEITPWPPVTRITQRPSTGRITSTSKKANPISPAVAASGIS
jgi:predicted RecB family nuclease